MAIPISRFHVTYCLFWLWAIDGNYSVKVGYEVVSQVDIQANTQNASTSFKMSKELWKEIWSAYVPYKIIIFCLETLRQCYSNQ